MSTFREAGWVWEGLGFDQGVAPTLYGVDQGTEFFGLSRANFMFQPNTPANLARLGHMVEVVPEISKWKWVQVEPVSGRHGWGFANHRNSNPDTVIEEAANLSRASLDCPNVTGALIDDTFGMFDYPSYGPDTPRQIMEALHSANPALKLWLVIYTRELDPEKWAPFVPYMDIVNLWVWKAEDLPRLDEHVARCRELFPGKEIVVGSYLRDYDSAGGVPLEHVQAQYEIMFRLWAQGRIRGYNILGTWLIEAHLPQAEFIRDFIADHS